MNYSHFYLYLSLGGTVMTFQQLLYVSEVAHLGSINKAAQKLFISQSSISNSIKALEAEFQIQIFSRSTVGICLTPDGKEFLTHARSLLDQKNHVEKLFKKSNIKHLSRLTIASQHLAFPTKAMIDMIKALGNTRCEFCIKELLSNDLLEDVMQDKSDLGIMFLSDVMQHLINSMASRGLEFHELCRIRPQVCVRLGHPLAKFERVKNSDLTPYPYLAIYQDYSTPFDHIEEIRLFSRHNPSQLIYVTDRASIYDFILNSDAYQICSGMRTEREAACTKLLDISDCEEELRLGWFKLSHKSLSSEAQQFLDNLTKVVLQWAATSGNRTRQG